VKKVLAIALILLSIALVGVSAQGKTITVWCWDPSFNIYAMQQAAQVYNKAHPDVTINIVNTPDDALRAKVTAGLQAGGAGLPDIALFQDFAIEQFLQNYPNAFVDLKAAGVDYSKFAPYKVGPMTVGSHVYGIPFDSGSTGLWLRTDVMKAAGLNPDSYAGKRLTWSQVIKIGEVIKAKTGKPLLGYQIDNFDMLRIIVQSTGAQFFKPDGSLDLHSAAFTKSMAIFKELYDKGLLDNVVGWSDYVNAIVNPGNCAGFVNAVWATGMVKSNPANKGLFMVLPTPIIEGVKGAANASNNGGSSWYVFAASPNKAIAVDFLKSVWATTTPDTLAFYNTILKGAGAMGTYLPSTTGSNYTASDDFFYKSQPVFKDFAAWMSNVPVLKYTPNYVQMRDSVAHGVQQYFQGQLKTPDDAIAAAEAEYKQVMGQ